MLLEPDATFRWATNGDGELFGHPPLTETGDDPAAGEPVQRRQPFGENDRRREGSVGSYTHAVSGANL